MKKIKIFPKTFLYTLGVMIFIVVAAHLLLYLLAPRLAFDFASSDRVENSNILLSGSIDSFQLVAQSIKKALPVSLFCCMILSAVCSYFFSKGVTIPIQKISQATERMAEMDRSAVCSVDTHDEIEELSNNINQLYCCLFSTIDNLETEKQRVNENERAKIDFMRAASHELKTPVTALNATLENMILGVGRYKDYETCLPECKEMVEQLSGMIHDILETSKVNLTVREEKPVEMDLSKRMETLCEPYQLIAAAHGVHFYLDMPQSFFIKTSVNEFSKAVSNIISNAVTYTKKGKKVYIYMQEHTLVIENECVPINKSELAHLFEPFYRPEFSRSRESGGNGLGLYIVAAIFSALNISYTFVPMEQPQGMRFTIYL